MKTVEILKASNKAVSSNKLPVIAKENVDCVASPSTSRNVESHKRKRVNTQILSSISTPSSKLPKIIESIPIDKGAIPM